jgi:hypothetical protein
VLCLQQMQKEIDAFIQSTATMRRFPPMKSSERAILHTVAAKSKLCALAFGVEGDDRAIVAFKLSVVSCKRLSTPQQCMCVAPWV